MPLQIDQEELEYGYLMINIHSHFDNLEVIRINWPKTLNKETKFWNICAFIYLFIYLYVELLEHYTSWLWRFNILTQEDKGGGGGGRNVVLFIKQ